jgi:hypothetical protein
VASLLSAHCIAVVVLLMALALEFYGDADKGTPAGVGSRLGFLQQVRLSEGRLLYACRSIECCMLRALGLIVDPVTYSDPVWSSILESQPPASVLHPSPPHMLCSDVET